MPHPNAASPSSAIPLSGTVAQLILLEPSLGSPAALPLLLARLMGICWVEEEAEATDPGDGE